MKVSREPSGGSGTLSTTGTPKSVLRDDHNPPAATSKGEDETPRDLEKLDPKRWEVSVRVDGEDMLTIGSHGYLAGYENIDLYGDAVRAAAEHLRSFIGSGEPVECFACGGSGQERWVGYGGTEEVGPCSVCNSPPPTEAVVGRGSRDHAPDTCAATPKSAAPDHGDDL